MSQSEEIVKVLLVNTYHYLRGGDCTHAFALAELLRSHGHEVRFFGMRHEQNVPCEDSEFWVPEIDFERLNRHKTPRSAVRVLARTIYSSEARRHLDRMLEAWTPDVAHIHNIHGHISPSVLDSFASHGVPVIWTLHDYRLLCPNTHFLSGDRVCEECSGHRYWRCVVNKCKKGSRSASAVAALETSLHRFLRIQSKVSAFIAPSQFLRSKFIEFGYPADKVRFIRNFLPDGPTPSAPDISGPAAYIGQLASWKGVATLLLAIAALPGKRLIIVGDGPDRVHLERLSEELGVTDRVHFVGKADRLGVLHVLSECAFVVAPSICYENSPYSVMEALASGRPVVASDIGGLPELVVNEHNGLTVKPGDATALADAMRLLWEDERLLDRLSAEAVRTSAQYARGLYYQSLMEVYGSVLGWPVDETAETQMLDD